MEQGADNQSGYGSRNVRRPRLEIPDHPKMDTGTGLHLFPRVRPVRWRAGE